MNVPYNSRTRVEQCSDADGLRNRLRHAYIERIENYIYMKWVRKIDATRWTGHRRESIARTYGHATSFSRFETIGESDQAQRDETINLYQERHWHI